MRFGMGKYIPRDLYTEDQRKCLGMASEALQFSSL